jgi:hypothetical protein
MECLLTVTEYCRETPKYVTNTKKYEKGNMDNLIQFSYRLFMCYLNSPTAQLHSEHKQRKETKHKNKANNNNNNNNLRTSSMDLM